MTFLHRIDILFFIMSIVIFLMFLVIVSEIVLAVWGLVIRQA